MKVTFLGTAANGGVPQIDCGCSNCTSGITRFRSSVLVKWQDKKILLDCGPDFRSQMLRFDFKLQDLTTIALTHLHWDHAAGLVELACGKPYQVSVAVPKALKVKLLQNPFWSWLFKLKFAQFSSGSPNMISFVKVDHATNFDTFAIKINLGGKIIIYVPDLVTINGRLIKELRLADLVIFDGTFSSESRSHLSIQNSAPILKKFNQKVIFTHINHSENPFLVQKFLDRFGFKLAFDGMEITV